MQNEPVKITVKSQTVASELAYLAVAERIHFEVVPSRENEWSFLVSKEQESIIKDSVASLETSQKERILDFYHKHFNSEIQRLENVKTADGY
jgi:hypothetical protein